MQSSLRNATGIRISIASNRVLEIQNPIRKHTGKPFVIKPFVIAALDRTLGSPTGQPVNAQGVILGTGPCICLGALVCSGVLRATAVCYQQRGGSPCSLLSWLPCCWLLLSGVAAKVDLARHWILAARELHCRRLLRRFYSKT